MTEVITRTSVGAVCDRVLIQQCVEVLRAGGVIVYPSDTVYGLGCDATNPDAVARVRRIKGREESQPILAMIADLGMLEQYAVLTPLSRKLSAEFLPGPLSLILTAHTPTLSPIASSDGSLGFRIPNYPFCLALAEAFHTPITATSVNRSGREQPRTVVEMLTQLGTQADDVTLVIDVGELPTQIPSTVVDGRGTTLRILREGALPSEKLVGFFSTLG
jgi:L-threonylcarbamoyladenylate synthase